MDGGRDPDHQRPRGTARVIDADPELRPNLPTHHFRLTRHLTGGRHGWALRTVAPDPAVVGARLRAQLGHPHGVALAQERLPQAAERRPRDGCAPPAGHPAGRLHDAPPIEQTGHALPAVRRKVQEGPGRDVHRSEEHTSELQSLAYLVCRLLLEKKKKKKEIYKSRYIILMYQVETSRE